MTAGVAGLRATAARHAERPDEVQRAVEMGDGFGVDDQPLAAGLDEALGEHLGRPDHQVGLERQRRVLAGRGDDVRPEGEVRDELAVHDVALEAVAAGGLQRRHLVAQAGEVRREDGGDDLDGGHRSGR